MNNLLRNNINYKTHSVRSGLMFFKLNKYQSGRIKLSYEDDEIISPTLLCKPTKLFPYNCYVLGIKKPVTVIVRVSLFVMLKYNSADHLFTDEIVNYW